MTSVSTRAQRRDMAPEERRDRAEMSEPEIPEAAPTAAAAERRVCVRCAASILRHLTPSK
jgi:hypothetical protein